MLNLMWRIGGIDPQLIARCPLYERWRYLSLSVLIGSLGCMVSVATVYLVADTTLKAPSKDWPATVVEWGMVLTVAIVMFMMNLSIYRLALASAISNLQVPHTLNSDKGHWTSFSIRVVVVGVFGVIVGSAVCYRVLGMVGSGDLSVAQRDSTNRMTSDIRGAHGEPISDLYLERVSINERLVKLRKPVADAQGSTVLTTSENERSQISELENRLDMLSEEISAARSRAAESRRIREREMSASQGVAVTIEREFSNGPGLCILIYCMSIGLYAVPLILLHMGANGPYIYLVSFQNILALAKNKIVPEANFVWTGSKKHSFTRYLIPEAIRKAEEARLDDLRRENQKKLGLFFSQYRGGDL